MAGPPYIGVHDVDRAELDARDLLTHTSRLLECVHNTNDFDTAYEAIGGCCDTYHRWSDVLIRIGILGGKMDSAGHLPVVGRMRATSQLYSRPNLPNLPLCAQLACLALDIEWIASDYLFYHKPKESFAQLWPKLRAKCLSMKLPHIDYESTLAKMTDEFSEVRERTKIGDFEPTPQKIIDELARRKQEVASSWHPVKYWAPNYLTGIHADIHRGDPSATPPPIPHTEAFTSQAEAYIAQEP